MADQQSDSGRGAKLSYAAKQLLIETTKAAFQQLSGLLKNITLYPASHPYLISLAEKMLVTIEGLLESRKEVAFYLLNGELFFETNSVPIDENTAALMEQFASRDIGGIVFKPGITMAELIKLAILTSKEPAAIKAEGGIIEVASREGIVNIQFHRGVELVDKKPEISKQKEEEKKASDLFKEAIEAITEIANNLRTNKTIGMRRLSMAFQAMADSIQDNRDPFIGLINVRMQDNHAFAHLVNSSILAMSLAFFLSLKKSRIVALGIAAVLHDIGKARIPLEIINKPDIPTDEEWEAVERHPLEGAFILSDIPGISKMAMVTAFEHHQHGGVNGYPRREGPVEQHLFSQIISLADAYEVLNASRVYYKVQMPHEQVIGILAGRKGRDFNAVLVKAFIKLVGIFPIGTLLKLSSGETGLVVHQTEDPMRPCILLLNKFDGSEKESDEEISLLEMTDGKFKRDIVGTINPATVNIDLKLYMK
jgi:HD-GYP domain-containing protein (c-di-GMP phosphodiesterase class II)